MGAEHVLTLLELYLLTVKPEVMIVRATAVDFSGISNCFYRAVEFFFFSSYFYNDIIIKIYYYI